MTLAMTAAAAVPIMPTVMPPPLGSLSLHHCTMGNDTIDALMEAGLGPHLAILDLTSVNGLTDDMSCPFLAACPHLQRLSLKNGQQLTYRCLKVLCHSMHMLCIDVGGCFNISAHELMDEIVPYLPALMELHASGLGWNNDLLEQLMTLSSNTISERPQIPSATYLVVPNPM